MHAFSRRDFARLLGAGSAALAVRSLPALAAQADDAIRPAPASPDERYWLGIREQFVMPREISVMNAANLCPSFAAVLQTMYDATRDMDRDPSFDNRAKLGQGKEQARRIAAEFIGADPEDVLLARNTSEANNMVSSGLDLGPGDEVVIFSDNHPSNHAAWHEKAKRHGFTIVTVDQVNPHPGDDHYLEAFARAMTPRTKVVAMTHLTNTVGDLLPVKALCRLAREGGALSLVDGAQSLGLIDVDMGDMQPDFYTGSAHKWPCGPKEVGLLYVSKRAQPQLWPGIVSAGAGQTGLSKTHERLGQRDEPAIIAFGEAMTLQMRIGKPAIEQRTRELSQALLAGLSRIDGIRLWTHRDPARSLAVVTFQPGSLDPRALGAALYRNEKIGCAVRGGANRGGLRISPHFYNLHEEIDRTVAAIGRYLAAGSTAL